MKSELKLFTITYCEQKNRNSAVLCNIFFKTLNINGLLAYENKAYIESIESFKKALELAPDYEVAAQNLKTITSIKESM